MYKKAEYLKLEKELKVVERAIELKQDVMEREVHNSPDGGLSDLWFAMLAAKNKLEGERATILWNMNQKRPQFEESALNKILITVCNEYRIPVIDVLERSQAPEVSEPRQMCWYFLIKYTNMHPKVIGECFSNRDRNTVIDGAYKLNEQVKINQQPLAEHYRIVEMQLEAILKKQL